MAKRSIKFKKPMAHRLPKPPDLTKLRGSMRDLAARIRVARIQYMRDCQEAAAELRGKGLADYLITVARAMITSGLYSDGSSVGQQAYCIMLWFARFEAGNDFYARHHTWRNLRGMTTDVVNEMRGGNNRRRIVLRKAVAG